MKNKKIISFVIVLSLLVPCFGGVFNSYAKSEEAQKGAADNETVDFSELAPIPSVTELEPDIHNEKNIKLGKKTVKKNVSKVIYTKTRITNDAEETDIYNIGGDDMEDLLEQGFTAEDILEADDIANTIFEDPMILLQMKKETGKMLDEVKDLVLEERKEERVKAIKKEYEREYSKLLKKGFTEDEIISLISYLDMNQMELTNSIIKEYKSEGKKLFQEQEKESKLSKEYKTKYKLSAKEAEGLTDDVVIAMEKLADRTGKSVEELLKSFDNKIN
ncbi:MAG: hypothetical protein ACERKN_06985 [Velocimicrobium sp.]